MSRRESFERIRPWVVVIGLLLLGLAFAAVTRAILADHELRVLHQWNGVTGTPSGIVAHAQNAALANGAATFVEVLTAVLGVFIVVPRVVEPAWFRWGGWLALVVAVTLAIVSVVGLLGLSVHHGMASFDPNCPLDAECSRAAQAVSPEEWRVNYLGLLILGATVLIAALSVCVALRWMLWTVTALARRNR